MYSYLYYFIILIFKYLLWFEVLGKVFVIGYSFRERVGWLQLWVDIEEIYRNKGFKRKLW